MTKRKRDAKGKFVGKEKKETKKPKEKVTLKDNRLDKVMPAIVDMFSKLLNRSGLMRYRADFVKKVQEVMDDKETEK